MCNGLLDCKRDQDVGKCRGKRGGGILFPFVFLQTCSPFAKAEEVEFLHGPLNDQPSSSPCIIKTLSRLELCGFLNPRIIQL